MTDSPLEITSTSGTYMLVLRLMRGRVRNVGKLGRIDFGPGWYFYVGSAFGPGGLAARIGRHLRVDKKRHWHIDFLCDRPCMTGVWTAAGPRRQEHLWARALTRSPFNGRPVPGFGCSDCRCPSHLIHFDTRPRVADLTQAFGARWLPTSA